MKNIELKNIDSRIVEFIEEHHVLTLSTCINQTPYISHCFYVYDTENNALIFTSDLNTKHAQHAVNNCNVAAGIALETTMIGQIRGVQILGEMFLLKDSEEKAASKLYIKKFPIALLSKTTLWMLKIKFIKFTDNRLGFGKKLVWEIDGLK